MKVTPAQTPVISLRHIRKSYGNFELGPVDLEIEPGYVVAVVGPNRSGKSTLLRMLMKQKVGYVPERSLGHDEMSAKSLDAWCEF